MFFSSAFNCKTAFILNPGTKFGITSLVFTSASKTFSDVKVEVVESLEILVISPSYTLSSSEISCLTFTLCPNFTDCELYSGIST